MRSPGPAMKWVSACILTIPIVILLNAEIIPDIAGTLSSMYLLTLSMIAFEYVIYRTVPREGMKHTIRRLMQMGILLLLLRGLKYSAFKEFDPLARHTWYLYYFPTLFMPLMLFELSILTFSGEATLPKRYRWMAPFTAALVAIVLTNDLHQLVFRFRPGLVNWDGDYSYGPFFYIVCTWQYLLYLTAAIVLIVQCRIRSTRKRSWMIFLPFASGLVLIILLITGRMPKLNGITILNFPECYCMMCLGLLAGIIQVGLIPSNKRYNALFASASISALITDRSGETIYRSESAEALTPEILSAADGTRTDEHTILHRIEIPGGYGYWMEDVTESDRLNAELEELRSGLAEEAELIRLQNELKEKRAGIEQRTIIYDSIATRTEPQTARIDTLMKEFAAAKDPESKTRCRNRIILLGAYVKRFAYLMLTASDSKQISAGDLGLSVAELLRYLKPVGVSAELFNTAEGAVASETTLALFEAFEELLESNIDSLKGVMIHIAECNGRHIFKGVLETAPVPLSAARMDALRNAGIEVKAETEDGTLYICFEATEGGIAV